MNSQAFNPYLPEGKFFPDGEPHVFGDRLYVYCSQDIFGSGRFCAGDYEVWSAPLNDLSAWSCKKAALPRKNKFNRSGFKCMWAPDCTRGADGNYTFISASASKTGYAWQRARCPTARSR